jgi:hypothetical protein
MSIILDALRKLEQKRRQGAIPDITTVHMPERLPRKEKKKVWHYLIFSALLINAAVILIWISGVPERPDQTSGTETTNAPSITSSAEDVITSENKTLEEAAESDEDIKDNAAPADLNLPVQLPENSSDDASAAAAGKEAAMEPGQAQAAKETGLTDSRVTIPPSPDEIRQLKQDIAAERASIKSTVEPISVPEPETAKNDTAGLTEFSRLPEDMKKELSGLSISGHIYSNEPSSRLVNIDGLIFHEGESVRNGLVVQEIAMDGVIFSYKGYRFIKRIF